MRLVTQGHTQTYGVDCSKIFAPVEKMNTVILVISLAATHIWELKQSDIRNTFLHGNRYEETFLRIPPGFNKGVNQD